MSDKPILFSGPMVRALLAETKTQTRRVLRFQPTAFQDIGLVLAEHPLRIAVGDRLWVREAWRPVHSGEPSRGVQYLADKPDGWRDDTRWKPGIHMFRWASRLTLTVTDVRVQRLQEISEADAIAEGMIWQDPTEADRQWAKSRAVDGEGDGSIDGVWLAPGTRQGYGSRPNDPQWGPTAAFAYRCVWDAINGPGSWDANPWVAAYTFTVAHQNIDYLRQAA